MMKGYKESIRGLAFAEMKADMFTRSAIVAYIFEKDKTKVLDDMLDIRSGGMLKKRMKK